MLRIHYPFLYLTLAACVVNLGWDVYSGLQKDSPAPEEIAAETVKLTEVSETAAEIPESPAEEELPEKPSGPEPETSGQEPPDTPEEEVFYVSAETGLQMSRAIKYVGYEPKETDSPYYIDRGLIALTTEYDYQTVTDDYFADAAFIGDSRMLGLHDYSGWNGSADFYCENGFSVYTWTKGHKVTLQSAEIKGKGTAVDLREALSSKTYGKIYLLAGMNDLGYGNTELFQGWMQQLLDMIRELQPDAVIYLLGNLHISRDQDDKQPAMNNINTNDKNLAIAGLADGKSIFYLDANPQFTDEDGYLRAEITFDGYHLYAANYVEWADFLRNHAVVK